MHNALLEALLLSLQLRSEDSLLTLRVNNVLAETYGMPGFDAIQVKVVIDNKVVYLMSDLHKEGATAPKSVRNVDGIKKIIAVSEYIYYVKMLNEGRKRKISFKA